MTEVAKHEGIKKIAELVKDIRIAMLVTLDERGRPRSRPMGTQDVPFDGTLWFLTDKDSTKLQDIARNRIVNVVYASTSAESYLSLSGDAEVLNDRAKIREFWNPFLRAWFESAEDPDIRILRIRVEEAEYWDTPGGKVASLFSLVKGAITGNDESSKQDDHQKVQL